MRTVASYPGGAQNFTSVFWWEPCCVCYLGIPWESSRETQFRGRKVLEVCPWSLGFCGFGTTEGRGRGHGAELIARQSYSSHGGWEAERRWGEVTVSPSRTPSVTQLPPATSSQWPSLLLFHPILQRFCHLPKVQPGEDQALGMPASSRHLKSDPGTHPPLFCLCCFISLTPSFSPLFALSTRLSFAVTHYPITRRF